MSMVNIAEHQTMTQIFKTFFKSLLMSDEHHNQENIARYKERPLVDAGRELKRSIGDTQLHRSRII